MHLFLPEADCEIFQQSGKQDFFRHTLKSCLVCMKVQAHIRPTSLEPPLEHNKDKIPVMNQGLL